VGNRKIKKVEKIKLFKMNKYSKLNKEELLEVCKIIHPDTQWKFFQVVDEEGNNHEFIGDDESILQFNLLEDETDELRFYYKGDIDGDLFDIGEDMVRNSEDKINDYLYRLINKNQEVENENFSGDDYNFTVDEIKTRFVNEQGADKFTKLEELEVQIEAHKELKTKLEKLDKNLVNWR
jgi:hypothetical protein